MSIQIMSNRTLLWFKQPKNLQNNLCDYVLHGMKQEVDMCS